LQREAPPDQTRWASAHCLLGPRHTPEDENPMSISGIDSSNDALQQAIDAQSKADVTNTAAQATAFQAQLQQSQLQQTQTQQPNGQPPAHHGHHGHHHSQTSAAGSSSSSSSSSSSQPSLLSMLNAIPDDMSKIGATDAGGAATSGS
jgi:hypothetical protein